MRPADDSHDEGLCLLRSVAEERDRVQTGVAMGVLGVWRGLGASAFLADVGPRDREPARIAVMIVAGACVGLVASVACWILILVPYTLAIGLGREGMLGLGKAALRFEDSHFHDVGIILVRLIASTATDGAFPLAFVSLAAVMTSRPFQHYVTAAAHVRWRLLVLGLLLSLVVIAPLLIASDLGAPRPVAPPVMSLAPDLTRRGLYVVAAFLLVPSAAAEELMFRGWLMHQVAAFTKSPVALVLVTAVAFSAAHLDFAPDDFLARVVMGAGFAYMALRLGGLELAVGAHAANNILFILFVAPFSLRERAAPGPWFGDIGLVAGYVLITEAVVRIGPLRRWAGVADEEISPMLGAPVIA
jgi:membrane protease YdiL (CAAX protease family)